MRRVVRVGEVVGHVFQVMNHGKIEQVGTPEDVYDNPANPFVYSFLGNVNLFHGRVDAGRVDLGAFTM